jgi:hypothetical protein
MKTRTKPFPLTALLAVVIIALSLTFTACFSDEESEEEEQTTTTTTTTPVPVAGSLTLKVSKTSVKSDNSDSAIITATVLDTTSAVIEGAIVNFSATGGQFDSLSSVATDSSGEAAIGFSAGPDQSNQTVTITATVSGVAPKTVPIEITGSTITLNPGNTNLNLGGSPVDTLIIAVKDAGGYPIPGVEVTVSIDPSSTGSATVSPTIDITDINGEQDVTVTGTVAGTVTVRVQAAGTTATQMYTVSAEGFGISEPTDDPCSLNTNEPLTITVNAPTQTSVQFATTLGAWDGTGEMVRTKSVSGGTVSATLESANAGVANVQVTDLTDPYDYSTTDTLKVAISAPSDEAAKISLQASATVVAPSTGDVTNSVTLTATVKNASDQPVGSAPVSFSIENPTGGGETVSPVVAITNSFGKVLAKFTSGSTSSDAQGVTVRATIVGSDPVIYDDRAIVIGGEAGSVVIGQGTKISTINNDTAYQLPMSVLVSDSNGNAMANATVSLTLWPAMYATGCWVEVEGKLIPYDCDENCNTYTFYSNEDDTHPIGDDRHRNLILDPGEDIGPPGTNLSAQCFIPSPNPDGQLTPPNSASGSVPSTVTTDENGVANFNLVYLKISAAWIMDELTATTMVYGTETRGTYKFTLPWKKGEEESLPHSPYNFIWSSP